MDPQSVKPELQCEKCLKILSKEDVKPVILNNGIVKKYCEECVAELNLSIKKDKVEYRKYRNNSIISWRREIILVIAIAAIIGTINLLYDLLT